MPKEPGRAGCQYMGQHRASKHGTAESREPGHAGHPFPRSQLPPTTRPESRLWARLSFVLTLGTTYPMRPCIQKHFSFPFCLRPTSALRYLVLRGLTLPYKGSEAKRSDAAY
eukprot:1159557-Pelagomonas_calceolata.AAC.16